MADTQFIYKGAYGFRFTITLDPEEEGKLATTTALALKIKAPSGVTVTKALTEANILDVDTGTIFYDVVDGDFEEEGNYLLEVIDTTPGRYLPTEIKKLKVKPSL